MPVFHERRSRERNIIEPVRVRCSFSLLFLVCQRLYPSVFLLFHSATGASTIGGIWNPAHEGPKQFKTGQGVPLRPVVVNGAGADDKAKVELDKRAILKEIERFGKGLVTKVELQ